MNYRIKEQYGFFFIEKEVETTIEHLNFWTDFFPLIFKPKKTTRKAWFEISERGYISGLMNPSVKFETKQEAQKAIENLHPKYHDVAQAE
jgi:hypothetical protein